MGELWPRWEGHILIFVNSIDNWKLWLVEIEDALLSNVYWRPVRRLRWRIKHVYLRENWTCDLLLQFSRSTVTEDYWWRFTPSLTVWSCSFSAARIPGASNPLRCAARFIEDRKDYVEVYFCRPWRLRWQEGCVLISWRKLSFIWPATCSACVGERLFSTSLKAIESIFKVGIVGLRGLSLYFKVCMTIAETLTLL